MPAASPPPPSFEDLLTILSRVTRLEANFPDRMDADLIELRFTFKREHLGPAGVYVFDFPSWIFPAIREKLKAEETFEALYRGADGSKTISDTIAFIEQELKQATSGYGVLYDRMKHEHMGAAIKYLRELRDRRAKADQKLKADDEVRRKAEADEIRRRVEEEIRRREKEKADAKAEAHRRWEAEEEKKRQKSSRQEGRYSDPFGFGPFGKASEEANRGYREYMDRMFEEALRGSKYQDWYGGTYSNAAPETPKKLSCYQILGVPPGASKAEIQKAYRRKAAEFHPDRYKGADANERMAEINVARDEAML